MERRTLLLNLSVSVAALGLSAGNAMADWEPRSPITAVVPYGAGGGTDSIARALTTALGDELPVPMVVVNRPGSSGLVGASSVAQARADGSTIMITSAGSFVLNSLMREVDVDPFEDFTIVAQIGDLTTSLMVPNDSEYETIGDLISAAEESPEQLRWAHTGRGSFHHIAGRGFLNAAGIEAVDVPFQGGANTRTAVMGGQVDFGMIGIQQLSGFEDELRPLALVSAERDGMAEEVPTFAETGLEVPVISSPIMVMVPRGTPEEVVESLDAAIQAATGSDLFAERMASVGSEPAYLGSTEANSRLEALREAARPVIEGLD